MKKNKTDLAKIDALAVEVLSDEELRGRHWRPGGGLGLVLLLRSGGDGHYQAKNSHRQRIVVRDADSCPAHHVGWAVCRHEISASGD